MENNILYEFPNKKQWLQEVRKIFKLASIEYYKLIAIEVYINNKINASGTSKINISKEIADIVMLILGANLVTFVSSDVGLALLISTPILKTMDWIMKSREKSNKIELTSSIDIEFTSRLTAQNATVVSKCQHYLSSSFSK